MARYHFNVSDGYAVAIDHEGVELADERAVQEEAVAAIRHLLASGDEAGMCRRHWRLEVTDEIGVELFTFPFAHALKPDKVVVAPERAATWLAA